ncbi:MAG: S41 family peptidase, partial [Bacteroidota bacterium]
MKKRLEVIVTILALLGAAGCNRSDDAGMNTCGVEVEFDGQTISYCPDNVNDTTVELNRVQDEFIWQAMNLFYYWQDAVPFLSDNRFDSYDELHAFLNDYSSSEELFESLLVSGDVFSWIVDDYVALEQSFQGTSRSFGYEFRLLRISEGSSEVFGYVKYVVPGGPAERANLTRGTLFNKVDGTTLTVDNFENLLFGRSLYDLGLASLEEDQIISTNEIVTLVSVELTENPIHLSKMIDVDGLKVGYLVYNQFVDNNQSHRELNALFEEFRNQGVSDLVLDLRYNPGGALSTTVNLASMIYSGGNSDTQLGQIIYNSKLGRFFNASFNFNETLPIQDDEGVVVDNEVLNRLSLSRVFVLTSGSTASASELLIVSLSPYMEVITIGTGTVGKNVGSITLYDTKNTLFRRTRDADINSNHSYAMQPIISQLANSDGFSDYAGGLEPDIVIDEKDFLDDLKPLGDIEEPLLAEALNLISGAARKAPENRIGGDFK